MIEETSLFKILSSILFGIVTIAFAIVSYRIKKVSKKVAELEEQLSNSGALSVAKVKTDTLEVKKISMGNFDIKIVDGELSLSPKK